MDSPNRDRKPKQGQESLDFLKSKMIPLFVFLVNREFETL